MLTSKTDAEAAVEKAVEMNEEELQLLIKDESAIFKYIGYYYLIDYHQKNTEMVKKLTTEMGALETKIPKSIVLATKKDLQKIVTSNDD